MKKILSDQELQEFHHKGTGFIYNDYGTDNKHDPYNVLHDCSCVHVRRMDTKTAKYHFDSIEGSKAWLESNRGAEGEKWRRCKFCLK